MSKKYLVKNCVTCGRKFRTSRSVAVYCSNNCGTLDMYRRSGLPIKICKLCKSNFRSPQPRQIYCTKVCSSQAQYLKYKKSYKITYWDVLSRDNFQCQYCGRTPTEHGITLHMDHIKPRADGGKDELDNIVTACSECNLHKSDRPLITETAFKERLQRKPKRMNQQNTEFFD